MPYELIDRRRTPGRSALFAIIQYFPDPRRQEGWNVGVVTVAQDSTEVQSVTLPESEVAELLPRMRVDPRWLPRIMRDIRASTVRLLRDLTENPTVQGIHHWRGQEAGHVNLAPQVGTTIWDDPSAILDGLYQKLVVPRSSDPDGE